MALPLIGLLSLVLPAAGGGPLDGDGPVIDVSTGELRRLHRLLTGGGPERWETIPWSTDLLEAVARARRARQPLFMWAMNGHPLGCV